MTARPSRPAPRATSSKAPVRRGASVAPDATIEPDPGPAPEAVFDRITGPYVRRPAGATLGTTAPEDA